MFECLWVIIEGLGVALCEELPLDLNQRNNLQAAAKVKPHLRHVLDMLESVLKKKVLFGRECIHSSSTLLHLEEKTKLTRM